jgi:glyceraldehyde-3-phosphate dehydrogenase (NAD(P))
MNESRDGERDARVRSTFSSSRGVDTVSGRIPEEGQEVMKKIVHIVGTGTIGEPLIGLFTDFRTHLGLDEVTFHKRTPLEFDKARIQHLIDRGARLAVEPDRRTAFEELGLRVDYDGREALERATVVIDCTPAGNRNKEEIYQELDQVKGFLAQGSEFGFGKPYARGINEEALEPGTDRFVQIVSCNTHNITTLIKTLSKDEDSYVLGQGNFVCMRRANDVTQPDKFIPAPSVGRHEDPDFGTHHARDAHHVFETLNHGFDLFSSAVKLNTQYMHSIWFRLALIRDTSLEEVVDRLRANPRVALTDKQQANIVFSFGRDHGYYGRILSQTVVVVPTLAVRHGREVYGFCFTPQDGNSLISSVAAALWHMEQDWQAVSELISPLRRWVYQEI